MHACLILLMYFPLPTVVMCCHTTHHRGKGNDAQERACTLGATTSREPLGGRSRCQGVSLLQANLAGPAEMSESSGDQGSAPIFGLKEARREKI